MSATVAEDSIYDLCVVGAGMAGLNALAVVTEYLEPSATVAVVDVNPGPGGMWHGTYDFVRLHQPHRLFTAGNMPWQLDKPPEYLARKDEVLAHTRHCWSALTQKLNITSWFSHRYLGHRQASSDDDCLAIQLRVASDSTERVIKARRLIKAFGLNVPAAKPLHFQSDLVRSITPASEELFGSAMLADGAPVYIVGGGKTATDVAYELVTRLPDRKVEMFVGPGTAFFDRSKFFPSGLRRYHGGTLTLEGLTDIALHYDGENDDEAFAYFRDHHALHLPGEAHESVLAIISPEEIGTIVRGVSGVYNKYLTDVVTIDGKPMAVFRDGEQQPLEPGAWIVNCTGALLRGHSAPEPIVSCEGKVLSIQLASAIFHTGVFNAYFLTHLWLLGQLPGTPVYAMNHETLFQKGRPSYFTGVVTQLVYNTLVIMGEVPMSVMQKCGINFDNWYPFYRQLFSMLRVGRKREKILAHCKQTLDKLDCRYGLQATTLSEASAQSGSANATR